jgi:hypothetical protein
VRFHEIITGEMDRILTAYGLLESIKKTTNKSPPIVEIANQIFHFLGK